MLHLKDACFETLGQGTIANVSFDVNPGEIVVVTGEGGAGKSALLFGCLGFTRPRSGQVMLFGRPPAFLEHDELFALRTRCALSSPAAPLVSNQSLRENIALPLVMRGLPARQLDDKVEDAIERFELARVAGLRPEEVLPRHRELALAARALVTPASLYVLDDPVLPPQARNLLLTRVQAGASALVAVRHAPLFPEAVRVVQL